MAEGRWVQLGEARISIGPAVPATPPAEHPDTFVRCEGCGATRKLTRITVEGVDYLEQLGSDTACAACGSRLGPPDEIDERLANLIADHAQRADVDAAADIIAGFVTGLTDRGVDSWGAAVLADRLATGHLDPAQITKRWQR